MQKRDVGRAVGIVLGLGHARGDVILVALEIDDTVLDSIAAADMTNGDFTLIVSSARFALIRKQTLFGFVAREFGVCAYRHKTTGRGSRFIPFNCHNPCPPYDNELKNSIALESAVSCTIAFL